MSSQTAAIRDESEGEYRAIEAALLESARGRWFLSEHGRRARRLDSALLEDAIGRLQTSLRQPPALLGQLQGEIQELQAFVGEIRSALAARPAQGSGAATHEILKSAEDVHELAWSLQANPFDPQGCEAVARGASRLYALSQTHGVESERVLTALSALETATQKLDALLETVRHELHIDMAERA